MHIHIFWKAWPSRTVSPPFTSILLCALHTDFMHGWQKHESKVIHCSSLWNLVCNKASSQSLAWSFERCVTPIACLKTKMKLQSQALSNVLVRPVLSFLERGGGGVAKSTQKDPHFKVQCSSLADKQKEKEKKNCPRFQKERCSSSVDSKEKGL